MKNKMKALVGTAAAAGTYVVAMAQALAVEAQDAALGSSVGSTSNGTPVGSGEFRTTIPEGYATTFGALLSFVLRATLAIGALLVFAYLVLGGIEYITSGGDKGKTEKARDKITSAVIGLIILAASWAILNLALSFLGLGSLPEALDRVNTINQQ